MFAIVFSTLQPQTQGRALGILAPPSHMGEASIVVGPPALDPVNDKGTNGAGLLLPGLPGEPATQASSIGPRDQPCLQGSGELSQDQQATQDRLLSWVCLEEAERFVEVDQDKVSTEADPLISSFSSSDRQESR